MEAVNLAQTDLLELGTDDLFYRQIEEYLRQGLLSLPSSTSVAQALELLSLKDDSYALVQDSPDTIQGIFSKKLLGQFNKSDIDLENTSVGGLMERRVLIEPETATVNEVLDRMIQGRAKYLVVVDIRGVAKGIVSLDDLLGRIFTGGKNSITDSSSVRS